MKKPGIDVGSTTLKCVVLAEDGSLLFAHEYADDEGLIAWMLSCRDKVTVLEPQRVREKLYQITSEIARRYEGEQK